jgi:hypothetical protein
MYLYLLNNKAEVMIAFNTYKVEEEKQQEKKMKIIRSDIEKEHYGRNTPKREMISNTNMLLPLWSKALKLL